MKLPLEGLKFIDFTWVGAGPFTTKLFADFGAEVIKIESSKRPDQLRRAQPLVGKKDLNSSGYFSNRNTNKKSITLDMKNPRSREIVLELVKDSDVIINSFSPNTLDKFGLSYEEVKAVKPDIIYLSMPMLGSEGPYKHFVGFGGTINSIIGLTHLTGLPNRIPLGTGTNYPDHIPNPCHAAFALFAALEYRNKTGKGQKIDLSQVESSISVVPVPLMNYAINGIVMEAKGNQHSYKAPYGIFPCQGQERWCAISVGNDREWEAFCLGIENAELLKDERFNTQLKRYEHRDILNEIVEEWTKKHTPETIMHVLQSRGVPVGIVQNAEDLLVKDENLRSRGFWRWLEHPVMGKTVYHGIPFRFSNISTEYRTSAPLLGQHTEEIIKSLPKFREDYEKLKQEGVFE